jgi:molybdenum cofactor biosynthesis enzyme MoaA
MDAMGEVETMYLRASVASVCNLDCVYCPKASGMEDRSPPHLAKRKISVNDYVGCLAAIASVGIRRVSFTGGEPTTNQHLPDIIRAAADLFDVVELTSNGYALPKMMPAIAPHLDLIKVSLDSLDRRKFARLAQGPEQTLDNAVVAIEAALGAGIPVGINFVLMRTNRDDLEAIVDFAGTMKAKYNGTLHVSVLDFYYSDERRDTWQREYIAVNGIADRLADKYGNLREELRFGCRFAWVNCNGVEVRFKDSAGPTMRGKICDGCRQYCQEGLYGVKLSTTGWMTTCPSNDFALGADLATAVAAEEARSLLADMVGRVSRATADSNSFATLLRTHGLAPTYPVN